MNRRKPSSNEFVAPEPTSTATTQQTEPEVVAAIASGDPAMREQAIRERAYAIWEEEGRPEGRHLDHWLRAEVEVGYAGKEPGSAPPAGTAT
jgi:hypothetical protein